MKTEEGASFLERGETNMVSHRPRKRTWTNQTKGTKEGKNLGEKGPMNVVQHSPCAKSAARGGAQRSLRHHRRLQRSEVDGPARIAARQVYSSIRALALSHSQKVTTILLYLQFLDRKWEKYLETFQNSLL